MKRPKEELTDAPTSLKFLVQAGRRGRPLLLMLDYDGTLVEIAPQPELARPEAALLALLGRLAARQDLRVMVVSGRPLRELQELLPVPGLDFLGSHGGEAFIAGRLHPVAVAAHDHQELSQWRHRLAAKLQPFQGWRLEDKPQGFALHYRQVPAAHAYEFIGILEKWRERLRQTERFQLLAGKKVLEILPRGVSKGAAIEDILLLSELDGFFPIYCGDDITDESAFRVLKGRGLTIKVGRFGGDSAASHFLPDPEALRHFLSLLAAPEEDS